MKHYLSIRSGQGRSHHQETLRHYDRIGLVKPQQNRSVDPLPLLHPTGPGPPEYRAGPADGLVATGDQNRAGV